ncbi:MAG: HD domain-containing protein [Bradymonadaceae bacterium]|nr:HD domain-containing protein [Lujinxingiaceae bacterium]
MPDPANSPPPFVGNGSLSELEIDLFYEHSIVMLSNMLKARDPVTHSHCQRVSDNARQIAEHLNLPQLTVEHIADSALIHDIGKLALSLEDLHKAEPLSALEYEQFKSHTTNGKWILEHIRFLHPLIGGVYHHHERWDGGGYPLGLAGNAIPLMARIIAVADAFDAITSQRAYQSAQSIEYGLEELASCSGTQFDPQIVDAFLIVMQERVPPRSRMQLVALER